MTIDSFNKERNVFYTPNREASGGREVAIPVCARDQAYFNFRRITELHERRFEDGPAHTSSAFCIEV
ncbi:MAG: hypothetical protein U5K54_15385 [Cytophagales bacterium]|nr:hypothetical protein [Cytophagales bacterium]